MAVCEDHLELVSNGDTDDHVTDSGLDSANGSVSLLTLEPHLELENLFAVLGRLVSVDLDGDVLEGFSEGSEGALDGDFTGLDADSNFFWDL
jgi:hypothetical protein